MPELSKGKGVQLQKYKNSHLCDLTSFNLKEGLKISEKKGALLYLKGKKLENWLGKRGESGKKAPNELKNGVFL